MIIGASLGAFKWLNLQDGMKLYLELLKDFDIKAVEIRFEKEPGRPSLWAWEESDKLADFLANFEVTGAHLPLIYLNPVSLNPGIRNESLSQLKMAITKAAELNMNYALMHARGFAYGLTHAQQLAEWERVIGELADYAESCSILLTVENCDFLGNLKELATIIRKIDSKWLKLTLDVGHAYIRRIRQSNHLVPYPLDGLVLKALDITPTPFLFSKYMPYEEYGSVKHFLESALDLVFNLHIHDYDGRRDHLTIGSGKIDFSFLPMVSGLPLIIEAEFRNHYQDFKRNYEMLVNFMGQG